MAILSPFSIPCGRDDRIPQLTTDERQVKMAGKETVVVAMSGGVDSSVSAALLVEQGYNVIGLMLRLWSEPGQATGRDNRCCTRDQMLDAHFVARRLGVPFQVIDARETFKREIVDLFVEGYSRGITPNPCLACNRHIRFTLLLNEALARGGTHLATGHYARITRNESGEYELRKGADLAKDQSYVLSVLTQEQLSKAMFPVGGYTKPEVRQIAARFGLPVATKNDSQDLCFVADGNYRRFLRSHASPAFKPGPIATTDGVIIGEHTGLADYTIGQRKGLGISSGSPLYVVDKDVQTNTLIVGDRDRLGRREFIAENLNWISGTPPNGPFQAQVKIRYKATALPALVVPSGGASAGVCLDSPVSDITPGQGAVFYDGDRVVGGGIIA